MSAGGAVVPASCARGNGYPEPAPPVPRPQFAPGLSQEQTPCPSCPFSPEPKGDEHVRTVHDRVTEVGHWPNLYATLANAPDLLAASVDFASDPARRPASTGPCGSWPSSRVAQLSRSDYEWQAPGPMRPRRRGPTAKLAALGDWRRRPLLGGGTARARRNRQPDRTGELSAPAQPVVATFGERQVVEVVLTIAFYSCVSRVLGGLGVPADHRDEEAPGFA